MSWNRGQHRTVRTSNELDALLDRIDAEARHVGRPQNVELTSGDGLGTLGLVVGADRSVLNHTPSDANPPYLSSVGDHDKEIAFTFYVAGSHHSEAQWRHTVPATMAREAAREFLITGRLDERIRWEEI